MIAPIENLMASLERAYMENYLKGKGYTRHDLLRLPPDAAKKLRVESCFYASSKLAELETRSLLVRHMHGEY
jgi:hypothetical protein